MSAPMTIADLLERAEAMLDRDLASDLTIDPIAALRELAELARDADAIRSRNEDLARFFETESIYLGDRLARRVVEGETERDSALAEVAAIAVEYGIPWMVSEIALRIDLALAPKAGSA